ncbi:Arylamine N-acetyltransferase [Alphaproteobacteria bacterium SO-S41]|nr:Arylamine N-acetyltransferase [Alphaproteobacteria bacterium SO-S41]
MDLAAYFARIGYDGPVRPDAATLIGLHRAHRSAVPYENLDVQLGIPLTVDPQAAWDKIVTRRRGGWCFEQNGVFALALEAIGFRVTRLAGAVLRAVAGDIRIGNHLVLLVDLGEPWVADVGFGAGGPFDPTPLREGPFGAGFRQLRLERIVDGWWRYHALAGTGADSFDFHPELSDPAAMVRACAFLQTAPESPFVNNAMVNLAEADRVLSLVDRTLTIIDAAGIRTSTIADETEYRLILARDFRLEVAQISDI